MLVDSNINFSLHINSIENKVASIGILSKLQQLLPTKTFLLLYNTIFHPHLLYQIQIRSNFYPTYLRSLEFLQNRNLRNIGGGKWMKELLNVRLSFTF